MEFNDFIKKGLARKTDSNKSLIKSLVQLSKNDLIFLKRSKLDDISARKILTGYYDVLRMILEAIALTKDYKIYSHEGLVYFLLEIRESLISQKFDRFRKLRNKLTYYGQNVSAVETRAIMIEILKIIKMLQDKYLKNYS